jgi:hypothetical protein
MKALDGRGIPCDGLDEAFRIEQTRKSNLLLEGRLLDAQGRSDAATEKFAAAAEIEEHLVARCRELGLQEKAWYHHRSAIGTWARTGNFYTAIRLGEELLADPALPERVRQSVQQFQETMRTRRREWVERTLAADAAAEAAPIPA